VNNDNDNWSSLNNDVVEFIYKELWMTWERNQNLYYLRGINFRENYVHIRKMNDLIEKVARKVAYKLLISRELLISKFLQVLDCLQN